MGIDRAAAASKLKKSAIRNNSSSRCGKLGAAPHAIHGAAARMSVGEWRDIVLLTTDVLDEAAIRRDLATNGAGAISLFIGLPRRIMHADISLSVFSNGHRCSVMTPRRDDARHV